MYSTAWTNPPQRRTAGLALIRDENGRVLLMDKAYRAGADRYGLVGGMAHAGEPAPMACQRHIRRETGLRLVPGALLVVHHMPANGEVKEGDNFVFACEPIPADTPLVLPKDEFRGYLWAEPDDFRGLLAPYTEWRINLALAALEGESTRYIVGHPDFAGSAA
jgi:ADP-ribose pyrophosphatase YjhB (NUDIX family)